MNFPKRITLEFTNFCNLRCVFCPRRYMEKETGFMDVELARKLISEISLHAPVVIVPFFRGESLTHPHWDTLFEMLHEHGLDKIQMATNASLLTEEKAKHILSLGVETLSFSMDTLNPELYRKLRGCDYDVSLNNVLRLLELRKAVKGKKHIKTVQVSAVKTVDNAHEIDDFISFWSDKVDRVRIYPEHSTDGCPGSLPSRKDVDRKPCNKVYEDMVIYWNGDIGLCNHDWTRLVTGQHIGSVKEKSIQEVWQSPAYKAIREAHESCDLRDVSPCEHCQHWVDEPVGLLVENA
ncbi:radical SAM protein [Maridesulfovibrio sp.]|uniref:radical SAM/SPASM domain-containing protein n=1 Tax=Maridesulfovibrio sp. TaxID=2795000 RepID=UPI0029C9F93B|nr:radical SAM protein [Maridesulfovibrio sp.]